jgi:hypothetical protein
MQTQGKVKSLPGRLAEQAEPVQRQLEQAEMVKAFLVSGEYRGRFQ